MGTPTTSIFGDECKVPAATFDMVIDPMPPTDAPLLAALEPSSKKKKRATLSPPAAKAPLSPPAVTPPSPPETPQLATARRVIPELADATSGAQEDTVVAVLAGATMGAVLTLTAVYIFSNILIK